MKISNTYNLAVCYPELAVEWDWEENGELTPQNVAPHSNKKVGWKCSTCRGKWQATINSRSAGSRCPYCTGKRVIKGKTDLATRRPDLIKEWHWEKNGELKPSEISEFSNKKVWWKCLKNPEHIWQTKIQHRSQGSGCPFCRSNRLIAGVNDAATTHPELIAQLHPYLNGDKKLSNYHATSTEKFVWICAAGHSWKTSIYSRTRGSSCPVCMGVRIQKDINDLPTLFPQIAAEWDVEKNGKTPGLIAKDSEEKARWKCSKCGFSWKESIIARVKRHAGSPICQHKTAKKVYPGYNDLQTNYPEIAAEWHIERNGSLKPYSVTQFSNQIVWWKCEMEHSWQAAIYNRTLLGEGCPVCQGREIRGYS